MRNLKKIFLVSILFTLILVLSAATAVHAVEAAPSVAWSQTYPGFGDSARSVVQTKDGGFLLLTTDSNSAYQNYVTGNFWLLKVDSSGNQQWNRSYAGTIYDVDSGQYAIQTSDGGYAAIAEYQNKLLLIKTDPYGNELWNRTYAGAGTCAASAIIQTSDGGYALLAVSDYGTSGSDKVWLVKTDWKGNPQWNQTLDAGDGFSLIQTSDGGYAIAGEPDNAQFMLLKTDPNGNLQLNETYGDSDEGWASSVVQTNDGGYAIGGYMWLRSNGGGPNIAIVKTDAAGSVQWTQYYGSGVVFSMTQTSDGGFAIAGDELVKADSFGNEQWEIGLGGQASSVIQTQDGGYAIAGYAAINQTVSGAWLVKIDVANANPTTQPTTSPSPTVPEFSSAGLILVVTAVVAVTLCAVALAVRKLNRTNSYSKQTTKWVRT